MNWPVHDPDDRCVMCWEENPNCLERHHVVPTRFGGTVEDKVTLCRNHHQVIERLYDDEFYERIGAGEDGSQTYLKRHMSPTEFKNLNVETMFNALLVNGYDYEVEQALIGVFEEFEAPFPGKEEPETPDAVADGGDDEDDDLAGLSLS